MFTHRVSIQLKPYSLADFSRKIKTDVMPLVRLQKGFLDGNTFISPSWTATEDTHWETKEDAEAYQRSNFQSVLKTLSGLSLSAPTSSIFEATK
jgi:hypothetical protein